MRRGVEVRGDIGERAAKKLLFELDRSREVFSSYEDGEGLRFALRPRRLPDAVRNARAQELIGDSLNVGDFSGHRNVDQLGRRYGRTPFGSANRAGAELRLRDETDVARRADSGRRRVTDPTLRAVAGFQTLVLPGA